MYMREQFHNVLPQVGDVLFDVTQAAQWFLRDGENATFDWRKLPPITPPFDTLWMEFYEPSQLRLGGELVNNLFQDRRTACGVQSRLMPDDMREYYAGDTENLLSDAMKHRIGREWRIGEVHGDVDNDSSAKWMVSLTVYQAKRDIVATTTYSELAIDERGQCIGHIHMPFASGCEVMIMQLFSTDDKKGILSHYDDEIYFLSEMSSAMVRPFLFCLALLNCRNVEVVDKPAPPAPILKQRAKKGIPYIQYKTLEVKPLRKVYQNGKQQGGEPEPKALHFVRGHFKDFTAKGLFGKYKGVYWWDSTVRGDVSKGVIDKDYRVSRD